VEDYATMIAPIAADQVDVVVGRPSSTSEGLLAATVSLLGRMLGGLPREAARPGVTALRTSLLQDLGLVSDDDRFETELRVKLCARRFRFGEAQSGLREVALPPPRSLARARAYLNYGIISNDADNVHEGYNTLARMDQAPRYNAWLGRKLRAHLGPRVLEIGAGIGTITRELLLERELIIALEADAFYVERLRNVFRDEPRVRPVHAPVEETDWASLANERLDSVVLSNVLEHIEDDALAIRQFRSVLTPGGTLVTFVPALPVLYGTIDRAIGHFRRYTPNSLRQVIEAGGFRIDQLEWMNVLGIPGWFLNNRILKRRSVPPQQLRVYDQIAPLLARAESAFRLPIGMSLLAVATAV
jgi:SAM-dependent methyltransferase